MPEEQVLRIPAELDRMNEVLDFASSLMDAHGTTPETRMELRIALEELFANIARYAYASGDGWAEIRGSVDDGVATFTLIDAGTPFDPLANPDPDVTLSGKEREIGGLGIYLVKNLVDEMEYSHHDGRNHLILRKHL